MYFNQTYLLLCCDSMNNSRIFIIVIINNIAIFQHFGHPSVKLFLIFGVDSLFMFR